MAEQFLHGADVLAALQKMRGEAMPQRVATGLLGNARSQDRLPYPLLHQVLMQVVQPLDAIPRVETGVFFLDSLPVRWFTVRMSAIHLHVASALPAPRLLDQVRAACRVRHFSLRTEVAYIHWIRRYIVHHGKRHPREMREPEVNAFLTDLAVRGQVSASTQNQALAALLFLYEHVLAKPLDRLEGVVRAKRPKRLPVVLSRGGAANS